MFKLFPSPESILHKNSLNKAVPAGNTTVNEPSTSFTSAGKISAGCITSGHSAGLDTGGPPSQASFTSGEMSIGLITAGQPSPGFIVAGEMCIGSTASG